MTAAIQLIITSRNTNACFHVKSKTFSQCFVFIKKVVRNKAVEFSSDKTGSNDNVNMHWVLINKICESNRIPAYNRISCYVNNSSNVHLKWYRKDITLSMMQDMFPLYTCLQKGAYKYQYSSRDNIFFQNNLQLH